jgi:hypothetical protein
MSKIKIQGNASGTGVVTLTAPATSTDKTITLPDTTATLVGSDASGNVEVSTGNLVIGTAGKGIDFSAQTSTTATGAAASSGGEVLDHYEEGTWTPTFGGSTANGTHTYTFQYGNYTRIGNVVHLSCDIQASSISGQTGQSYIRGFPFASSSAQSYPVPTFRDCTAMTTSTGYIISGFVNLNSSYLYMQSTSLTTNTSTNTNTWDSSGRMNFTTTYTVS